MISLIFLNVGCVSITLTQEQARVKQIEDGSKCKYLGEAIKQDKWAGDFEEVKKKLQVETLSRGGDSYLIDHVRLGTKITLAHIYKCH